MLESARILPDPRRSGPDAQSGRKAVRVASGSADGLRWSVWAKKGIIDPYAIEQGGMVLNGATAGLF